MLGSAYRSVLADEGAEVVRLSPPWTASDLPRALAAGVRRSLDGTAPVCVVWAAGVGRVGAPEAELAAEHRGVAALCDVLAELPAGRRARTSVVFASSAGALFAGVADSLVDDATPPSPTSDYGRAKLAQEQLLQRLGATGVRVVSARISNLYGLAGGALTRRGLVSTAVLSARLRRPMTVYVSADTRRDYLWNGDAARLGLQLVRSAEPGFTARLVRDGRTRTVSEVLTTVGRVARRRVPVVYAQVPESRLQPPALRFAAPDPRDGVRRTPLEAAVARMLLAPERR